LSCHYIFTAFQIILYFQCFLYITITRVIHTCYNISIEIKGGVQISSKEIIKLLKKNGWYLKDVVGSHHHFKHPDKKEKVTVPHPRKDLRTGTEQTILKQAGLK